MVKAAKVPPVNPVDLIPESKPPEPPVPPTAPSPEPDDSDIGDSNVPNPKNLSFIMDNRQITKTVFKYRNLQERGQIVGKLDDDLVVTVIDVLEQTHWEQTGLVNLVFRQHFTLNDSGFYALIAKLISEHYFEREDATSLKYIRDQLKPVAYALMQVTQDSLNKMGNGHRQ